MWAVLLYDLHTMVAESCEEAWGTELMCSYTKPVRVELENNVHKGSGKLPNTTPGHQGCIWRSYGELVLLKKAKIGL
jgi:hypothetical protein